MRAKIFISKGTVALLSVMLLALLAVAPAVPPAQRFVTCYQALGRSPEPLSAWERLAFSYLLARNEIARAQERPEARPGPERP